MDNIIWLIVGVVGALGFVFWARSRGPREQDLLIALALFIAAAIYVAFGALWGNWTWVGIETGGLILYGLTAWLGIKHSSYWLAVGWAGHVFWDSWLHLFGPGVKLVPDWYAYACISFDIAVAIYVVYEARRRSRGVTAHQA